MSETTTLPPHWHSSTWPAAWNLDENKPLESMTLERVGYVLLPNVFYLVVHFPELWGDEPEPEDSARAVILTFEARENEVNLREIYGSEIDLADWIGYLAANFPPNQWKPFAISQMTRFLALDENRKNLPPAPPLPSLRGSDLQQQRHQPPPLRASSKRHRITEKHLDEVVRIYAGAVEAGQPPTRAVAESFKVAHSTAAKWVGKARQNGKLEGVAQKWGIEKG